MGAGAHRAQLMVQAIYLDSLSRNSLQTILCFLKSLIFFGEAKAYHLRSIARIGEETGARHRGHSNRLHQIARKLHVVLESEAGDVRHDVVSSGRTEAAEPGAGEDARQKVA